MKKFSLFLLLFLFATSSSCNNQQIEKRSSTEKKGGKTNFEMYQVSEMTALMERFYANNQAIRKKILAGDTDLGSIPEDYVKIHTAALTDSTDRDQFLEDQATHFLTVQEEMYHSENQRESFNIMVDACISCHKVKCSGPIERIKKLYLPTVE